MARIVGQMMLALVVVAACGCSSVTGDSFPPPADALTESAESIRVALTRQARRLSDSSEKRQWPLGDPPLEATLGSVPTDVVEAAWELIVSRVGSEFVLEYVVYDSARSKRYVPFDASIAPHSNLVFHLASAERRHVQGRISFCLDDDGHLDPRFQVNGIPQCDYRFGGCEFTVDEAGAKQIACDAGLDPGIDGYELEFEWSSSRLRYVWSVRVTYERGETDAWGKSLSVDAHSGEVYGSLSSTWETYRAGQERQVTPN